MLNRVLKTLSCFLSISLVLFVLFFVIFYSNDKIPNNIIYMLNSIVIDKNSLEDVLPLYLTTSQNKESSIGEVGLRRDVLNFSYVLGDDLLKADGYKITAGSKDYVEIVLLSDDVELYPRILFLFSFDKEGFITDYTLAREQPFSRLNKEYDSRWLD